MYGTVCGTFSVGFPLSRLLFARWSSLFSDFDVFLFPVSASGGVSLLGTNRKHTTVTHSAHVALNEKRSDLSETDSCFGSLGLV